MKRRGETESDAGLTYAASNALGRKLQGHTEQFEDVRSSGLRRGGSVAVFTHRRASGRGDDGSHRRDVDRMRPVATRPDDVNACLTLGVGERNYRRLRHRHGEQSSEFVGRFALGPQRNEETGNLRWSGIARQDLGQRPLQSGHA